MTFLISDTSPLTINTDGKIRLKIELVFIARERPSPKKRPWYLEGLSPPPKTFPPQLPDSTRGKAGDRSA